MIKTLRLIVKVFLFSFIILVSAAASGITVNARVIASLPAVLVESSAVDFNGDNNFWSLNDAGHTPDIYCISKNGTLTKTIRITNAINHDWEEMTHDAVRNFMYIGDFGNNNHDRTNLKVYRIPYPSSTTGTTASAEEIDFSYPDQTSFPAQWLNFDAESFFHFQDKLYIFTKADGSAIGYTKMYSIPDSPGNYLATLVDSFYTNDRTTSADISPDGSSVVLISNTHIHIFRNFSGADFFGGQHTQLNISGSWTQKEGVSFGGNNEIYMTDENSGSGNHLYYLDLSAWIPSNQSSTTSIEKINEPSASVYPVPANQFFNVRFKNFNEGKISFALFDVTGKKVFESQIENPNVPFMIPTEDFNPGIYFCKIFSDALEIQTTRIIISH